MIWTSEPLSSSLNRIHKNDRSYATMVIFGELNMAIWQDQPYPDSLIDDSETDQKQMKAWTNFSKVS